MERLEELSDENIVLFHREERERRAEE